MNDAEQVHAERIPQEQNPDINAKRMDVTKCRIESADDAFHVLMSIHCGCNWQSVQIVKNQFDLRRYFDIIVEANPEVVVETGCQAGGSSLFFMDVLEMITSETPYIGIDIPGLWHEAVYNYPHPHMLIRRDCLHPDTIETIRPHVEGKRALIVLDSVHTEAHVDEELRLYAPLCGVGSYLVVEDTDHEGHPILADYGPSARRSVAKFMAEGGLGPALGFERDYDLEYRYGKFTNSPDAWLKKVR